MKQNLSVAIVGTVKGFADVYKKVNAESFTVAEFKNVKELSNTGYYDAILLAETEIVSYKPEQFPNSALLVVTDSPSKGSELFPKIKSIHAYTIVALPVSAKKLEEYLNEAHSSFIQSKSQGAAKAEVGKSVLVTSFSNGSGKSLLSYNLAAKLASFFPENSVSLVDMNYPLSVSKAMLNIEDQYSWQILKPVLQEGIVDKQKIANIIYLTKYRFSLLSGPVDLSKNQPLSIKEFGNLDTSLKNIFKSVIYDFRTVSTDKDLSYFALADMVIIVVELSSVSILQTIRGLQHLRNNTPDLLEKVRFIVNKVDERKGKSAELVSSRLEMEPFGVIDNDPDAVDAFTEIGQLFEDKTLLVDKQLYTLAEKLVKELF